MRDEFWLRVTGIQQQLNDIERLEYFHHQTHPLTQAPRAAASTSSPSIEQLIENKVNEVLKKKAETSTTETTADANHKKAAYH